MKTYSKRKNMFLNISLKIKGEIYVKAHDKDEAKRIIEGMKWTDMMKITDVFQWDLKLK